MVYRLLNTLIDFELSEKGSSARGYDGSVMLVLKALSAATMSRAYSRFVMAMKLSPSIPSMGQAIMSALPESQLQQLFDEMQFASRTEHTIVERNQLLEQISAGRSDGYVYQREEVDLGMNAIARAAIGPTTHDTTKE